MERKSVSVRVIYSLLYFSGIIGALIVLLGDKEADADVRFHALQSIVLFVLNILCGIGSVIALVFAIIALVNGNPPKLPLIGDKCREWAEKK